MVATMTSQLIAKLVHMSRHVDFARQAAACLSRSRDDDARIAWRDEFESHVANLSQLYPDWPERLLDAAAIYRMSSGFEPGDETFSPVGVP
jgi:hypothetical protein